MPEHNKEEELRAALEAIASSWVLFADFTEGSDLDAYGAEDMCRIARQALGMYCPQRRHGVNGVYVGDQWVALTADECLESAASVR